MDEKMAIYFERKTGGEVPQNILNNVINTYSKFSVEYLKGGAVILKVPEEEQEIAKQFRDNVTRLLQEIKEKNSVLAEKLARRYDSIQLK